MQGSGWEFLPDVQEWSRCPAECPGVVGRPCRLFGSGRRHFQMSRMPSWISGRGREALPDVREWSEGPPGFLRVLGRPSLMFGSGREALSNVPE